jgi:hypothetical protein
MPEAPAGGVSVGPRRRRRHLARVCRDHRQLGARLADEGSQTTMINGGEDVAP